MPRKIRHLKGERVGRKAKPIAVVKLRLTVNEGIELFWKDRGLSTPKGDDFGRMNFGKGRPRKNREP